MAVFTHHYHSCALLLIILSLSLLSFSKGVKANTFTFINKCDYTVWPGILGNQQLDRTGFELPKGTSRSFQAPTGWSGRFWGRTGCNFDSSGHGTCATADCGSGQIECNGGAATPPATLAEFTLGFGSQDFYDVSLVDGYNLPMVVEGSGGSGACATTGCVTDLNRSCPNELRTAGGAACKSACEAFGSPEYCCSGAYNSPVTCKPSMYSTIFKTECPKSYSFAYDDATSTFTCSGADYTITFCPTVPSLKSASNSSPKGTETTDEPEAGSQAGLGPVEAASFASSWLANLAIGDSTRIHPYSSLQYGLVVAISLIISSHMWRLQ